MDDDYEVSFVENEKTALLDFYSEKEGLIFTLAIFRGNGYFLYKTKTEGSKTEEIVNDEKTIQRFLDLANRTGFYCYDLKRFNAVMVEGHFFIEDLV